MNRGDTLRGWWAKIPDVWKVLVAVGTISVMAFGAGLQVDFITEVPRTTRENRALLLSIDSALSTHVRLPAHPAEAAARMRSDSLIVQMVQRGDSAIMAHLQWIVCVERLDRLNPAASPTEAVRTCPPPGADE